MVFTCSAKGTNAGKPLREPCPNCFTVLCSSAENSNYWYWLSWGLWKSKSFEYYLRGSVIPFIRICDYNEALHKAMRSTVANPEQFNRAIAAMQQIEQQEQLAKQKLETLGTLKIAIFRQILHR